MKKIILLSMALLSGCASENSTRVTHGCFPHTGCALSDETPEQFEQRKVLNEAITKDEQAKSAQHEKDMDVCRYEAAKATGSSQRGYTMYSTIFNDVGDTFRQAEIIGLCMKSKGYARKLILLARLCKRDRIGECWYMPG